MVTSTRRPTVAFDRMALASCAECVDAVVGKLVWSDVSAGLTGLRPLGDQPAHQVTQLVLGAGDPFVAMEKGPEVGALVAVSAAGDQGKGFEHHSQLLGHPSAWRAASSHSTHASASNPAASRPRSSPPSPVKVDSEVSRCATPPSSLATSMSERFSDSICGVGDELVLPGVHHQPATEGERLVDATARATFASSFGGQYSTF